MTITSTDPAGNIVFVGFFGAVEKEFTDAEKLELTGLFKRIDDICNSALVREAARSPVPRLDLSIVAPLDARLLKLVGE